MYMRIVRGQPHPRHAEAVAHRWKEYVAPRLGDLPGFRHGYLSVERVTNRIAVVTIWDAIPDEAVDEAMQEFRQQLADITVEPPAIEDYEVLAELEGM